MTTLTCLELALICLLPDLNLPPPPPINISNYPAVMSIYDPSLGGINCDDDCSTVAIGPLLEEYWRTAGACHPDLLGATVHFPAIDFSMKCVDTGPAVTVRWSRQHHEIVLFFDVMWPINDLPYWLYWKLEEWHISWA